MATIEGNFEKKTKKKVKKEIVETTSQEKTVQVQEQTDVTAGVPKLPKMNDDQKAALINQYNTTNEGVCEITESLDEVDEEYAKQCKEEFEAVVKEANEMKFLIADKDKALETANFLAEWNANKNHWERAYWRGVIKFNEFIEDKIDKLEKKEIEVLEMDYPALIFIHQSMMRPSGVGLLEAQEMAAIDDQYNAILDVIGGYVDKIALYDKKAKLYQERWGLACNGFKMNILISDLEDFAKVNTSQQG